MTIELTAIDRLRSENARLLMELDRRKTPIVSISPNLSRRDEFAKAAMEG